MADLAKQTILDEHKEMLVEIVKNGPRNSIADVVRDILSDRFEQVNESKRMRHVVEMYGWHTKNGLWFKEDHKWASLEQAYEIVSNRLCRDGSEV